MIALIPFCFLAHAVYLKRHRRFYLAKESVFLVLISLYFFYYYAIPLRYLWAYLLSLLLGLWVIFVSQSYYLENYQKKQALLDLMLLWSSYYREHRSLYPIIESLEEIVPDILSDQWRSFCQVFKRENSFSEALRVFSTHYLVMNMASIIEQDQSFGNRHVEDHLLSLEADLLSLKFDLKDYDLRLQRYRRQVLIVLLLALLIAALSYRMILSIESLQMSKKEFLLYRFFLQSNYFLYVFSHRICWDTVFLKEENLEVR